jgi:hypothetical protein
LVAALREATRIGAVLLPRDLKRFAVLIATSEQSAVQVRRLIAGIDVGSGVRRRAIDAPAPEVDADLGRATLDSEVVQRPQRDLGEVPYPSHSRIDLLELETIEEHSHASRIAKKGSEHRLRDPTRSKAGQPGHAIEKILNGQGAGGKQVTPIPHEAPAGVGQHWGFRRGHRRLDRVLHDGRNRRSR